MKTDFPVTVSTSGIWSVQDLSSASADKCSSLLQKNHEDFHIFWNFKGYHNHQVHYLLTAWALGADIDGLQEAFDSNVSYQRPRLPLADGLEPKLYDERYFKSLMGNDEYFFDYTEFFKKKMAEEGWPKVVQEYLFSRSEIAEDMMAGLFAGVIHPLIHFGFGVEFEQPAVIAEGLSQAVCHPKFFKKFFLQSEELAQTSSTKASIPLIDLFHEIRKDRSLYDEEYWDGGDSLNDYILSDAPRKLVEIAAKWTVNPDELEEKTVEMINVNAFVAGAAQRHDKEIKLDFFFIHSVNASIFFSAFNAQTGLKAEDKTRILEWKGRSDLLQYAGRLAPELFVDEINNYIPQQNGMTWPLLIERTNNLTGDDGHIAKLVRALAHGSRVCEQYENQPDLASKFPLPNTGWLQIANMSLDTTKTKTLLDRWVRGAGQAKSWVKFAAR